MLSIHENLPFSEVPADRNAKGLALQIANQASLDEGNMGPNGKALGCEAGFPQLDQSAERRSASTASTRS